MCLVFVAMAVWQIRPIPAPPSFAAPSLPMTSSSSPAPAPAAYGLVTPSAGWTGAIDAALAATKFPSLSPPLGDLPDARVPEWHNCGNVNDDATLAKCTFLANSGATTPKVAAVIGDSIGITWMPALLGLQNAGYTLYGLTYGQCPAADTSVKPSSGSSASFTGVCNAHRQWAINQVGKLHADLVVLADSEETITRLSSGARGSAADAEWGKAVTSTIKKVRAQGAKRIALLSPPPTGVSLQTCAASPSSTPAACVSRVTGVYYGMADAERKATKAAGVTYIDVRLLFCASNDYCPAFIGHTPVRVDGNHLTGAFSGQLRPVIVPLVLNRAKR
jgi:hypothetical protein